MAVMRAHRFEVGQTVGVVQGSAGPAMPTGWYVVVRLMPSAQGEHHYRVKSATDGREWALAEGQMRPVVIGQYTSLILTTQSELSIAAKGD